MHELCQLEPLLLHLIDLRCSHAYLGPGRTDPLQRLGGLGLLEAFGHSRDAIIETSSGGTPGVQEKIQLNLGEGSLKESALLSFVVRHAILVPDLIDGFGVEVHPSRWKSSQVSQDGIGHHVPCMGGRIENHLGKFPLGHQRS